LPTNANLTSVICPSNGTVYIGGYGGTLILGSKSVWELIDQDEVDDDIWGLAWFKDELFISTMSNVYRLTGDQTESVEFGIDAPKTTYILSAADDVMWSIGRRDIMSYDGKEWSRIV